MSEIKRFVEGTMTGQQLINLITEYGSLDTPILFVTNYGDRGNTQQVHQLTEMHDAELKHLYETPYSTSGIAVREEDSNETDDPNQEFGIVLLLKC